MPGFSKCLLALLSLALSAPIPALAQVVSQAAVSGLISSGLGSVGGISPTASPSMGLGQGPTLGLMPLTPSIGLTLAPAVVVKASPGALSLGPAIRTEFSAVTSVSPGIFKKDSERPSAHPVSAADFSKASAKLGARFDGSGFSKSYLGEGWEIPFAEKDAASYSQELSAAAWGMNPTQAKSIVDAAEKLASGAGIRVERKTFDIGGREFEGLHIVPAEGASKLNTLAFRLKKITGADMDYVPERTSGAVAMFNSEERRLYLPDFGTDEAFPAILHEARHAFYSEQVARGETRLFHLSILPHNHRFKVSPKSEVYQNYMSLEELATFPKALQQMALEISRMTDQEKRERLISLLGIRALQYADIMRAALYNVRIIRRRLKTGELRAMEVPEDSIRKQQFRTPPGGKLYRIGLPHANLFFPVEEEAPRTWFQRTFGRADREAVAVLGLKAELIENLGETATPLLIRLVKALEGSPDIKELQSLSNQLFYAAQRTDRKFVERYAELRTSLRK